MLTPDALTAGIVDGDRFTPAAQVAERGRRAATGLAALGVRAGDSVALLLRNSTEWFEAWSAATALGACPVPLNWHLRPDEMEHILADCAAKALIGHSDLLALLPSSGAGRPVLQVAGKGGVRREGGPEWSVWLGEQPEWSGEPDLARGALIYSSGTTGLPKGVRRFPRSSEQAAVYAEVARTVYGIEPGVRTVIVAPLYHSAPLYHATAAMLAGGLLVLQHGFDAARLLELVEVHRVTNLLMVPTMFVRLLALSDEVRAAAGIDSLRHVVHGAAPCPPGVKRRMLDWWGPIIHEYYGCTESGIVTAIAPDEWRDRPGCVGRPVPGAIVKVLGEAGEELAPGEAGDVYARNAGAAEFTYENRPDERRAVERDGLITCGDVGRLDADGYLFLLDRRKDMVVSGGVNIFPAEVEAELMALPGIADCAVFGIPDSEYGEVLAALITPQPGAVLDPEGVRAALRRRLGALKVPRLVEMRPDLPRDPSGKILKRALREPYWAGRGSSI